jgi:chemotaxis protein histidine kinase CheA
MSEGQLIKAPHTLRKAKIGNGPAKLDPAVLKKAEQAVVEMEKDFTGWALEDLNEMEAALGRLKDGGDMGKELGEVFRIALDMKGQGGSFGFVMITRIAGSLSDFMEERQTVGRLGLEAIAAHIGAMRAIMAQNVRDDGGNTGQALLAELQNLTAKAASE